MALQDLRIPTLGQAIRPNIWDLVALILVIGAMVLFVAVVVWRDHRRGL